MPSLPEEVELRKKIILYSKKFRFTGFSFNVVKDVFFQYASIISCPFN